MVPKSSVDSSGLVPMKSKFRQRTVRERACSPRITSCSGGAAAYDGNVMLEMEHLCYNQKT
jgi:hypothetical protein